VADAFVPGGRGFVQHLFRAKRELLQGVSELISAQIKELNKIDSAIGDESRARSVDPISNMLGCNTGRVKALKEAWEQAGKAAQEASKQGAPTQSTGEPPKQGAEQQAQGSGESAKPASPEKIKIA
jgi:hypothetical protein